MTDALWCILDGSPVGGVVESWFGKEDDFFVAEGLRRCGMDPAMVPEVWCYSAKAEASARPRGLGPTFAVDIGHGVGRSDVVRISLQVLAGDGCSVQAAFRGFISTQERPELSKAA